MSRTHLPRMVAVALSVGALLALPGFAGAQSGGTIQVHALFSGGKTSGFTVGQPLGVTYTDPSGQTREKQVCWSPAPIEQPACTASGTGAANAVGAQTITVQLTNGQSVKTTFNVAAAPTTLGSGSSNTPPVPYTVVKPVTLTGDVSGDPLYQLTPGDRVAAYYRANSTTLQVYDYATNTAGFAASSALTAPKPQASTTSDTFRLKSNRTTTYKLTLPKGFKAVSVRGSTPIAYQLYVGHQRGSGVGNYITAAGGGAHKPFLGATVIQDGISGRTVFVKVRTGALSQPITLAISAYGTS
jgi:hypothetical protein